MKRRRPRERTHLLRLVSLRLSAYVCRFSPIESFCLSSEEFSFIQLLQFFPDVFFFTFRYGLLELDWRSRMVPYHSEAWSSETTVGRTS